MSRNAVTSSDGDHISPEFSLSNPAGSFWSVFSSVLGSPKRFFLGFEQEGEVREPLVYAAIVGFIGALLSFALSPVFRLMFGTGTGDEVYGLGALEALGFVVVFPLFVLFAAGVFLLAITIFVGPVADFRQLIRMCAYAFSGLAFAWIPFVGAFLVTYSLLVLMLIGIRYVYRTTFLTALVVSVTGFVPLATVLIALRGLAFQITSSL
ncbi:YIP1 family protein [Rubrobacter radiotolerans]|nr:YIP1 family protein [Rubrobacter radiotolerans]MDX5894961.1 YIP1 family protein [Rubrobacter radiotolerans]